MYTILPKTQEIVGIPKTFTVTCEEPVVEALDFQRVRIEEFEFTGNTITLEVFPKRLKVYVGGIKLSKKEYYLKGKQLFFSYHITNENIVVQYEQDPNHN